MSKCRHFGLFSDFFKLKFLTNFYNSNFCVLKYFLPVNFWILKFSWAFHLSNSEHWLYYSPPISYFPSLLFHLLSFHDLVLDVDINNDNIARWENFSSHLTAVDHSTEKKFFLFFLFIPHCEHHVDLSAAFTHVLQTFIFGKECEMLEKFFITGWIFVVIEFFSCWLWKKLNWKEWRKIFSY